MFQFPACPPTGYVFTRRSSGFPPSGFPHSDILGSAPAHDFPRLFAVCHVLLRPLMPRHSPYALSSFTCSMKILKFYSVKKDFLSMRLLMCSQRQPLGRTHYSRSSPSPTVHLSTCTCGDAGTRTLGLLRAREALSHLSYIPWLLVWACVDSNHGPHPYQRCALNRLSYRPFPLTPE